MKYKKGLIFICLVICLFSIACVCASDVNETVAASEDQMMIDDENDDFLAIDELNINEVGVMENEELRISDGSFAELMDKINNADNYLKLDKNYIHSVNDSKYGISIDKPITIDGNGFSIDGNSYSRGFTIYGNKIILKNIIFKNFNTKGINDYGGAIDCCADNIMLKDCTFINCYSYEEHDYQYWASEQPGNHVGGGAVYIEGNNSRLINCNFENCYSTMSGNGGPSSDAFGGAIYLNGNNSLIENCSFFKCYADSYSCYGGAVYLNGINNNLKNSRFNKCYSYSGTFRTSVKSLGGAVYISDSDNIISNCNFDECYSYSKCNREGSPSISRGGAIFVDGLYCNIINCNFENCTVKSYAYNGNQYMQGAAIYLKKNYCNVISSIFYNNTAKDDSGIYCIGSDCKVSDSILLTNTKKSVIYSSNTLTADYNWWGNTLENFNSQPLCPFTLNNWLYLDITATNELLNVGESSVVKFNFDNLVNNGVTSKYYGINLPNVNFLIETDYNSDSSMSKRGVGQYSYVAKNTPNGFLTINYFDKQKTFYFGIEKGKTKILPSNINAVYNSGKEFVIILKDNYNHIISDINLNVLFNGKTKILKTNNHGQIKLSTTGLKPKSYAVKINFAGDDNYLSSSYSTNVIIKKATPKLTAKSIAFKKSAKTKKYSVTLKTNQNKVMKNIKLTLKVGKKTYTAKTNGKGVATFKITKLTKKGSFKAVITYKGNAYYNKVTKKVNIKCK